MTKEQLHKLIAQGEGQQVEFKKSVAELDKVIQALAAFANTNANGGCVLIGVVDKGKIKEVVIGKETIKKIADKISAHTDPLLYPKIEVVKRSGNKGIIVITIDGSSNKPHLAFGRAYKRVGSTTTRMTRDEYERLLLARHENKFQFDCQICEGATLEDIDEEKVRWFLRKAKVERNLDIDPATPVKETLERLQLLKEDRLTNAAILLFGNDPQRFFLQVRIRCARFKGNVAIDFLDMKIIDGNIIDQVDNAEKFILSHIKKAAKVVMFKREEVWEYPPDALREAIVNAVCHRDYDSPGNVKIAVFDDRVEITDPGALPEPLTPRMLKQNHESIPRNRLIANAFFLIKNIEQWGKGTNKIVQWCVEHGLNEPDFEEIGGGFLVKFYAPEDLLSLIPEKGKIDLKELGLNERQIEALRLMVNEGEVFTNKKYREKFNVSNKTAATDLNQLVKSRQITSQGKGRSIKYHYTINEEIT